MQKIVLFIEPFDDVWSTPLKIGNLFVNRFAIEEDAASEVLKIFELEKSSDEMSSHEHPNYMNFKEDRKQKGRILSILVLNSCIHYFSKSFVCIIQILL